MGDRLLAYQLKTATHPTTKCKHIYNIVIPNTHFYTKL